MKPKKMTPREQVVYYQDLYNKARDAHQDLINTLERAKITHRRQEQDIAWLKGLAMQLAQR